MSTCSAKNAFNYHADPLSTQPAVHNSSVHTTPPSTQLGCSTHTNRDIIYLKIPSELSTDLTHDVENRTSGTSDVTRHILSSHTLSHTVIPVPPTTVRRYVTRKIVLHSRARLTEQPRSHTRPASTPPLRPLPASSGTTPLSTQHNSVFHTPLLHTHTHSAAPHNSAVHTRACTVAFRLDSLGTGRANGDTHRDGRVWSHFGVAFPKHVLEGEALGDVGQALS